MKILLWENELTKKRKISLKKYSGGGQQQKSHLNHLPLVSRSIVPIYPVRQNLQYSFLNTFLQEATIEFASQK